MITRWGIRANTPGRVVPTVSSVPASAPTGRVGRARVGATGPSREAGDGWGTSGQGSGQESDVSWLPRATPRDQGDREAWQFGQVYAGSGAGVLGLVPRITIHHTVIVVAVLAAITILGVANKDTAVLVSVVALILGGIGWAGTKAQEAGAKATEAKAETTVVRAQTNGTQTEILSILREQGRMLASMQPTKAIAVDAEEVSSDAEA